VAASTDGHDLDLDFFLAGDNTIYLYAPAHQQRLLRPLFETITQQVVAAAQERAAVSPDGMLQPRLGLFLDEAGNCAALSDLDVLATTARGQGVQLVTVWHDKSQLEARYGPKASTILNNHRAKLFLSGLADLSALELGARLIGDQALVDRNRSMGSDGRHSLNESTSYRPLLPVEDLRRLRRPARGCCCTGTCGRPRSGCDPSTSRGNRPEGTGPRAAPLDGH
jgi:type IV secretion system protein VirD4